MKFVCDRCQTRYSIADEKVRQKILRIRCKTCGNVIVVQEERAHGAAGAAPLSASAVRSPVPSSGPRVPPPPHPSPKPDRLGGHVEWYLAVDGEQSGPFSRSEVAKRIHALGPGKSAHVWKEGMADWKPPKEVSVVVHELSLLRPAPPPPPVPARSSPPPPTRAATASALTESSGQALAASVAVGVAPSAHGFADVTTKKSELPRDHGNAPGDEFHEATTKRSKDLREVIASSDDAFGEATTTTKKNKSLPKAASASAQHELGQTVKTPPPARMSPSVGNKAAVAAFHPAPASLPAPTVAFDAPAGATAPRPSQPLPIVSAPSPLGGSFGAAGGAHAASFGSPLVATPAPVPAQPAAFMVPGGPAVPFPGPSGLPTPHPINVIALDGSLVPAGAGELPGASGRLAGLFQRQPGLKYVAAALAIVGLIILLVLVILQGKREPRSDGVGVTIPEPSVAPPSPVATADPPAPPPAPGAEKTLPVPPTASAKSSSGHSGRRVAAAAPDRPGREKPVAVAARGAGPKPGNAGGGAGARPNPFDESRSVSQSQITAVVRNPANQAALKSCYERALKMDNHLTSGRIDVTVSIGVSGAVQRVVINAPASFILVEPCIKSAVKRWVFPPNVEEYATNFPLIMQGGM